MKPELTVGHDAIDAQHRGMLLRIAKVQERVAAEDAAGAATALAGLWDETVGHFATEEALMEAHAYPERTPHRTAHHLFLEDLKALMRELREQGLSEDVATWARQRIPEWLTFHIETNDAPLARFVIRRTAARALANARGEPLPEKPTRRDA
jgi:hemerythrin